MAQPTIFISYDPEDDAIANRLVQDLLAAGADVKRPITASFLDQSVDEYLKHVEASLAASDFFLLVLTQAALMSERLRAEQAAAGRFMERGVIRDFIFVQRGSISPFHVPEDDKIRFNIFDATWDYPGALDKVLKVIGLKVPAAHPSQPSRPKVFVSHNHQDNAYCREFVTALRKGLGSDEAVWYDEHNMGWGKIRREIERELAQRKHFIAILSPTAVQSDWVNDEIDAAIDLRRTGSMQTIQFVVAIRCEMPLLLRNYKRVVAPDGQPYSAQEAARRALAVIQPNPPEPTSATPQSSVPQAAPPTYMQLNEQLFRQHAEYRRQEQAAQPQPSPIPPDRFPQRLADLGFTGYSGKGGEYILPPLCTVPAGPFQMGSDPQHTVTLAAYEIARFPATVAEYACFVRAGRPEPEGYEYQGRNVDWQTQLQQLDHPVVCVTWRDAVAYAAWLSERTGDRWRLATEAEWEKAARGTDGRIYPWGYAFDKAQCNTRESGIGTTTPVGNYPSGASPSDAQDMAGNVWEWTGSRYLPYPYIASGEREDQSSTGDRVLRGGSWDDDARVARAAYRLIYPPGNFLGDNGFRLLRAAPTS